MRNRLPGLNAYVIGWQPMFLFCHQSIKVTPNLWNKRLQFGSGFSRDAMVIHLRHG
jgi:hypothetical protein